MASLLETTNPRVLRPSPRFSASLAFLGLVVADIVLKLAGFRRLHQIVSRWPISKKKLKNDQETIAGVCETVERATNYYVKHAWCLQRSAVTTCFLRTKGIHAQMVIGCRRMPFHGHAWVEVNGRVVNDNQMVQTFYLPLYRC
jgi:hypothetical protein